MKKPKMDHLTDDELVTRFAEAAKERGHAVLDLEVRDANRMFHYMWRIDSLLRRRGAEARRKLSPLLHHENRLVRYYAALHAFALSPERAREIIEENHRCWVDAIALDAGMTLYNLDTGVFRPD